MKSQKARKSYTILEITDDTEIMEITQITEITEMAEVAEITETTAIAEIIEITKSIEMVVCQHLNQKVDLGSRAFFIYIYTCTNISCPFAQYRPMPWLR